VWPTPFSSTPTPADQLPTQIEVDVVSAVPAPVSVDAFGLLLLVSPFRHANRFLVWCFAERVHYAEVARGNNSHAGTWRVLAVLNNFG